MGLRCCTLPTPGLAKVGSPPHKGGMRLITIAGISLAAMMLAACATLPAPPRPAEPVARPSVLPSIAPPVANGKIAAPQPEIGSIAQSRGAALRFLGDPKRPPLWWWAVIGPMGGSRYRDMA